MDTQVANVSGGLVFRGVVAVLFGVAAVFWPGLTLVTLLYLFSAFLLINGIVDLVFGLVRYAGGAQSAWARLLPIVFGIVQVGVGVYLLRHPHATFKTFILLIGFTLIVRGVFEVVGGLFEDLGGMHRAALVLVGLLAVIAGILMLFQPVAGGVAFVWILGVYAIVAGAMHIAAASELNRVGRVEGARRSR